MKTTVITLFCRFRWVNGFLPPFCCRSHDLSSIFGCHARSSLDTHSQLISCISFSRCFVHLMIVSKSKVRTIGKVNPPPHANSEDETEKWWARVRRPSFDRHFCRHSVSLYSLPHSPSHLYVIIKTWDWSYYYWEDLYWVVWVPMFEGLFLSFFAPNPRKHGPWCQIP